MGCDRYIGEHVEKLLYLAQPLGQPVIRMTMSSLRRPTSSSESSSLVISSGRYLQ